MSRDIAASVKARLLKLAHAAEVEFQLYLVRYACERFLYRLGASEYRERCVLKGAGLLSVWLADPYRATRDVDLLAFGENDGQSVRKLMETVCSVSCPEDGLSFDLATLEVSVIRAEEEYEGQRALLDACLGKSRIRLQVDIGFGDATAQPPEDAEYPTLLDTVPAPRLRTYRREVSLAEKFEAMVKLGRRNSRMKDFHDAWALSSEFDFEGPQLRQAVVACFDRRGTPWIEELPDVLSTAFYDDRDLAERWRAYLRAGAFRTPPPESFGVVGERVREFLGAVRESVVIGRPFERAWKAGGPWR